MEGLDVHDLNGHVDVSLWPLSPSLDCLHSAKRIVIVRQAGLAVSVLISQKDSTLPSLLPLPCLFCFSSRCLQVILKRTGQHLVGGGSFCVATFGLLIPYPLVSEA
jgi:hypothetical protein